MAAHEELGQGDIEEELERLKLKPDPELDNFLDKVDEVSEIIKSLSSSDASENERGFRKADLILGLDETKHESITDVDNIKCRVKKERTVINKIEDEPKTQEEMDAKAFMKAMEKDAKERAERRKVKKAKSDEYRKKGNILFSQKDYAGALLNYNEAIKLIKDSPCLYNNRALTYIRLGIFSSAVEDCQKALKLEESSFRARMFLAKSYFLMGETDKCRTTLEEAKDQLPGHVDLIKDYENDMFNMTSEKPLVYDMEMDKKWQQAASFKVSEETPSQSEHQTKEVSDADAGGDARRSSKKTD